MTNLHDNNVTVVKTYNRRSYKLALEDISMGIMDYKRWFRFALFYIKRAYWRTTLGIAWPIVSFVLFVSMLSLLWGTLFGRDLKTYLPHFGYGFTCWIFDRH